LPVGRRYDLHLNQGRGIYPTSGPVARPLKLIGAWSPAAMAEAVFQRRLRAELEYDVLQQQQQLQQQCVVPYSNSAHKLSLSFFCTLPSFQ